MLCPGPGHGNISVRDVTAQMLVDTGRSDDQKLVLAACGTSLLAQVSATPL